MPLGSTLAAMGGSLSIGYLIYTLQDISRTFWGWPGILGTTVLVIGLLILIVAVFAPVDESDSVNGPLGVEQKQRGGRGSVNYQAGGNIAIGQEDGPKE
ncbi:hypothetical protein Amsp01_047690 [Amycolatopsis sp. NBRC 101858]|nr:hypothetical protein Amsp01_047690 [Amycolatopsis sp. NBRC 101858]